MATDPRPARAVVVSTLLAHRSEESLTCHCGWGPSVRSAQDLIEHQAEAIAAALAAAPAGTGGPTPDEAGNGGSDPNWPARRLIQARARVDELVRERDAAIAAAGPRGDKPLSVIVAEIVSELSQVQRERDAAREAAAKFAEFGYATGQLQALREGLVERSWVPVVGDEVPSALRMIDDYVALAQEQGKGSASTKARLAAYQGAHHRLTAERDEARSALAALRAEVERHAGAQCPCDTNGECLARLYEFSQARALVTDQSPAAPRKPIILCLHRDHDLSTNIPLVCVLPIRHEAQHAFRFACGATTRRMFELDMVTCVCHLPSGHEGDHNDSGTTWLNRAGQSPAAPQDPETSNAHAQSDADQWNSLYPIGTPVTYWPLRKEDGTLYGDPLETRTRTEAWLLGEHTPVVMVEGRSGAVYLEHIRLRDVSPTSATQTDPPPIIEPLPMTGDEAAAFVRAATECCGNCPNDTCYVDALNGEKFAAPRDTQTDTGGDEA